MGNGVDWWTTGAEPPRGRVVGRKDEGWLTGNREDDFWWEAGWREAQCSDGKFCQCLRCRDERRWGLHWYLGTAVPICIVILGFLAVGAVTLLVWRWRG